MRSGPLLLEKLVTKCEETVKLFNNTEFMVNSAAWMELVHDIVAIFNNYEFTTEVLVASIRNPGHTVPVSNHRSYAGDVEPRRTVSDRKSGPSYIYSLPSSKKVIRSYGLPVPESGWVGSGIGATLQQ